MPNPMGRNILGGPLTPVYIAGSEDGSFELTVGGEVAVTGPLTDAELRATAVPVTVESTPDTILGAVELIGEDGVPFGVEHIEGRPRVSAVPYLYDIAKRKLDDHIAWSKTGFTSAMGTTESDLWPVGGVIPFPTAKMGMEVVSTDNVGDIGTVIKNGTATGGTTTSLIDSGADFTAATAVAIGDTILVNKAASSPEFGVVTAITSATELAVAGGFSRGLTPVDKTYHILDYSAGTGAHAVQICYLTDAFVPSCEIVILNGTTVVPTVKLDLYRINAFRVVAAGSNRVPAGTLTIRNLADTPVYSGITAGFTRGRNSAYTVPAGYSLYVTEFTMAYGYRTNPTHFARLYTRATQFANTIGSSFRTPTLFYPFTDVVLANSSQLVTLDIPTRILSGVDIKVSGVATFTGTATVALRGWLEVD